MRSKVLVPVVLLSLGVFSTTTFFGCSSDSPKGSGTGGKGGTTATGGKGGSVGTGGSGTGGTGTGGSDTGGAGGTSDTGGAGGAGGTADTGGAGGTSATGGAGGGTAGAAGNAGGAAGMAATGGRGMMGGRGGNAGAGGISVGGAGGGSVGGAGGGATWPKTLAACPMPYPGVSVTDFCTYYTTTCGDMYSAANGHFASAADCVTKYTAYTATQKGCTAYHLCAAGTPNAANAHCLHPAGGGGNPCNL